MKNYSMLGLGLMLLLKLSVLLFFSIPWQHRFPKCLQQNWEKLTKNPVFQYSWSISYFARGEWDTCMFGVFTAGFSGEKTDQPIYRPIVGFHRQLVAAKTADFIGLLRFWQNTLIISTHPDILHKKAQRSKSWQLSYSNASRCGFINKQTRLTMKHA